MLTFLASLILPFIVQFVATIRKEARPDVASYPCKAGSAKEKIRYMADDFDAPLDDFAEYICELAS